MSTDCSDNELLIDDTEDFPVSEDELEKIGDSLLGKFHPTSIPSTTNLSKTTGVATPKKKMKSISGDESGLASCSSYLKEAPNEGKDSLRSSPDFLKFSANKVNEENLYYAITSRPAPQLFRKMP